MSLTGPLDGLADYPGLIPGVLIFAAVGLVLGRPAGRLLEAPPILAFVLVLGTGLAVSATLTPGGDALANGTVGSGTCDLSRVGLPSPNQLVRAGEVALNLLLLVPLGVAIGLLPPSRVKALIVASAYALPFTIEVIQLVVVRLGRECQSGDVIDNLTGLTLGIVASTALRLIAGARREVGGTRVGVRADVVALAGAALAIAIFLVPAPTAAPAPTASPALTATPASTATPAAPTGSAVRVTSIPGLLRSLGDDAVSEIVVADGNYHVSPAATRASDSLWIGGRFASRTNPVTVRAETTGGVTFDGGGTSAFGGITFLAGAHHQTWQGFVFANGTPANTGAIVFGGYPGLAAPHHITLRDITISRAVSSASADATDHAIYVSYAVDGPHDLLFEDVTVDGQGGLSSAFHFYGSDASNANAWNVTIRRLRVSGTQQAIILWDPTLHDISLDTATITNALDFAVRYESPGATGIVLANITSTGSGSGVGFQSSLGASPPGVTFINNSFR